jgi:hypothetical protein
MNALPVAARFTAFTCYLNAGSEQPHSAEEAGKLARKNWKRFLPLVDQELARFLTAGPESTRGHFGSSRAAAKTPKARAAG